LNKRVLLIESDEALGHWLQAVLAEAQMTTDWDKSADQAARRVSQGLPEFDVVIVEGVLGGQGVELCLAAKAQGKRTILLIPRGSSVMSGVADRILEHPLTRVGLEDAVHALLGVEQVRANPSPAAVEPPPVDDRFRRAAEDRLRMGRAALLEGNHDTAIIELDAAVALLPDEKPPRLLAAWARYARQRSVVREAADLRRQLAALCDELKTADAHFYAASVAHDFGDVDIALQHANLALHRDENHVGARQLIEILMHSSTARP
jgi:tetratricopeptide (TPR) repeat protein